MNSLRSLAAAALLTAGSLVIPTAAHAAVPPPPTPSRPMPTAVDVAMPYEGQTVCDQHTQPGVADFAKLMSSHYSRTSYGTIRPCLGDVSEHYDGRALDWMLDVNDPDDKAIADAVTLWLTKNSGGEYGAAARRFGIMYIIWNHKVWKSYRDIDTWTTYTGVNPHTDHIHFSFAWDGACKRTSWWTGKAVTTPNLSARCGTGPLVTVDTEFTPYKDTLLKLGSSGTAVKIAQANLPGVTVDGAFGPLTAKAVRRFQTKWGLDVTGRVNRGVWNKMESLQYPLIKYRTTTVLRRGMTGQAVKDAQRALKVEQVGVFGPKTEAAVKRVQGKYHLAQTGVIRELTWAALDEELRARSRQAQFEREITGIAKDLAATG